jgi:uncharacterized cupin superfamily protein
MAVVSTIPIGSSREGFRNILLLGSVFRYGRAGAWGRSSAIIDPLRRFNLFAAELQHDADDPEGYRTGYSRLGPGMGASMLAGTLYELPEGQSVCPYHYEHGDEEWLIVLEGRPTVRHVEGEDELSAGDVVCFVAGPEGAHKVTNRTHATVRVLIVSTRRMPAVVVYPDSDKVGVYTEDKHDDVMVRRDSNVDYWDRES